MTATAATSTSPPSPSEGAKPDSDSATRVGSESTHTLLVADPSRVLQRWPHTSAFRAASRALDHAIEAAVEGDPTHASGTTFVPAELAEGRRLSMYRRLGPVSVVDGNGEEAHYPGTTTARSLSSWG